MTGKKPRRDHHSYDEEVESSPKTIEYEGGDIESETPSLENEPVEDRPDEDQPEPPAFEEEGRDTGI